MGLVVFLVLAAFAITLTVWTCSREREKKSYRLCRLLVRMAQAAVLIIAMILPFGQKWRFVPALVFLVVLLVIDALTMLIGRNKAGEVQKAVGANISCVFFILFAGLFLIPAFIFTGYKGLPVSGRYQIGEANAILIDSDRVDPFENDGSHREVPVHFYYPVTPEGSAEQFPLVVFSHGAFGYYQSNTSTYMELASNGYVVAALDHPHHAFFTEDTDRKMITVDQDFLKEALEMSGEGSEYDNKEETLAIYRRWMDLRTADMSLAVDALIKADRDGEIDESWFLPDYDSAAILDVLRMTDTSKIGLMGHSMGGATSVALGRERNDIAAVIDIDGTMLSEYTGIVDGKFTVNEEPYEVPVLEFVNWEQTTEFADHIEEYRAESGAYPNVELIEHAESGFTTTICDTKHMDFTDLPLLSPMLGNMLGSGERDTAEVMTIVNSIVLEFYDCYLKGEGAFLVQESY